MNGRRIALTQYISQSLYAKERDYAIRYIFGGQFNYLLIVVFILIFTFTCKYFTLIIFPILKYQWEVYEVQAWISETQVYLKIQHSATVTVQHHILNFFYFLCYVSDIYGHFCQCIR